MFIIFMTGLSLAMDAFSVSITNGICLGKVRLWMAVKIGLFFGIAQGVMPTIGYFSGILFRDFIEKIDHWVAFLILFIIGINMIKEAVEKIKNPEECECKALTNKEIFFQAIATSIDALAVGVSFTALKNFNITSAAVIISSITFVLSFLGVFIGKTIGKFLREKAEIFGGAVLILIGIKLLLEGIL